MLSIGSVINRMGRFVSSYRFSCPLSFLFRTIDLVGHGPDCSRVITEGSKLELGVKPDVVGCCSGVFLPEFMALVTTCDLAFRILIFVVISI